MQPGREEPEETESLLRDLRSAPHQRVG